MDDLPLESSSERGNLDTRTNTNNIINTILPFDTKNAVKWNATIVAFAGNRSASACTARAGCRCTCRVWLYSYRQPGSGMVHYIAVNGRTGETMGSVPVQQWKLVTAALAVGTFLEGIALWIVGNM